MNSLFEFVPVMGQEGDPATAAWGILLRVTALLLAAGLVALALHRSSAALRHWVWTLSLVGTLLIPLGYWAFPAWQWAVLPRPQASVSESPSPPDNSTAEPMQFAGVPPAEMSPSAANAPAFFDLPKDVYSKASEASGQPLTSVTPTRSSSPRTQWTWPMIFAGIWILGTCLSLAWLSVGVLGAWIVARSATPASDSRWQAILRELLAACDRRRRVTVRESTRVSVPMTWGLFRPVILVPAAGEAWSEATRRSVLLHELGHVRRGDWLTHLLGRTACAVYWFHPLVWAAAARLRKTGEQAADDVVLSSNVAPSNYAEHLVGIAAGMRGLNPFAHAALPMASPSDLTSRVQAILDPRRNRRSLTRRTCYVLTALAATVLIPCALLRLGYAEVPDKASPVAEKTAASLSDKIIAGVGWRNVHVGMTREYLIEALGKPDGDPNSNILNWAKRHIQCTFHRGSPVVTEVRFNKGFQWPLENGVKLGSSGDAVLKLYGEPAHVINGPDGAKEYEYSTKGILFWTHRGVIVQIVVFKPYSPHTEKTAAVPSDKIIAGVGWRNVRLGMSRKDLIEALGKPDGDPDSNILNWAKRHIQCTFHQGSPVVSEVRFNKGFQWPLENGVKLGSSGDAVLKLYGEPAHVINGPDGAKEYEYSTKGILFWTHQGVVVQIVVFKPYSPRLDAARKPAANKASPTGTAKRFELLVVGPDGKPVPHASVEIRGSVKPAADWIEVGKFVKPGPYGTFCETDDAGRFVLKLPKPPKHFSVSIKRPGFGPYWAAWDSSSHPQPVPATFTAKLDAAWTVGGVVVDEDGAPVEGATVYVSIEYKKRSGDSHQLGVGGGPKTDADGRWTFPFVPVSKREAYVSINHPDYAPNHRRLARAESDVKPGDQPTARIMLKRGLKVTGRVTDESGKPIVGAKVRTQFFNDLRRTMTGDDGTYLLVGCEPRMTRIIVSASGKARDFKEVLIGPDMEPVDFAMKPGGKIRIRALDMQGNPIARTRVFFQQWRGSIEYWEFEDVNQYADAQGVWEWDEAPLDEIRADICPPGGMSLLAQPLIAREKEYVFRLSPALVISGDVTDASTGTPVKKFRVIPGTRSGKPTWMNWARDEGFEATDGHYELRSDRGEQAHFVRIEADGYEVAVSRDVKSDEGNVRIDFKLKPAADIAATLLTPSGKPAGGAEIALGIAGSQICVKNGAISNVSTYAARYEADNGGRFRFPAQDSDFQFVIVHPSGFAYLKSTDGAVPKTIRLTPWARVEGTFRAGKRVVPDALITLHTDALRSYGPDVPNIYSDYDSTTGPGGRFVFDRVLPGKGWIGRNLLLLVGQGAMEVTSSKRVPASYTAGETTEVTLGGDGRAVIGKLAPPADFKGKVLWNFALVSVEIDLAPPKSPSPPADVGDDIKRRKAWWEAWQTTEEGKAWQAEYEAFNRRRNAVPTFTASVARDGSFRIDDVPPGKYVLSVRFNGPNRGELAVLHHRFAMPDTDTSEPLDLETVLLKTRLSGIPIPPAQVKGAED